ncbi:hypothetical protein UFOVP449_50 [uncultured Caudovirales phage]|uniref:Uncharacterized protein n=1 Tax=uncultured Caudovirales phage TaxID=2100421 RepID=A0A6J5MFG1_9CAUD|nr:hypothetical protein UFOVP449_50 [uncultured Caudovirales phage]
MNKFREIVEAWRSKWRPSPAERELAERRLAICAACPSRKEVIKEIDFFVLCGECGCPLEAKAHSPKRGACDLGKWDTVDGITKVF